MAAVGIALLFVGSTAAATPDHVQADKKYVAPFSGTPVNNFNGFGSGCGTSGFSLFPVFNLTTGYANESIKGNVRSCGNVNSTAWLETTAGFMSVPFATTTGTHNIWANWTVDLSMKLVATPGSVTQGAVAYANEEVFVYLMDLTNNTAFYPTFEPAAYEYITSGIYSHVYKLHESDSLSAPLNGSHSYQFVTEVICYGGVTVTPGTSTASFSLNMSTGGKSGLLRSVVFK